MSVDVSVVIPVHNEAAILERAIDELCEGLDGLDVSYEIWLAENGSTDATPQIARALSVSREQLRTFSVAEPNYGRALKRGIESSSGSIVICEEIDLCDVDFAKRALAVLAAGATDMVVGSKLMTGARDDRPFIRHAASQIYSSLLRLSLGFPGTDTHGLKAFRRSSLAPVVAACVIARDVFASELVIRSYRAGLCVKEIPVQLHERRPPSVGLLRRVPRVIANVVKLARAIR